MVRSVVVTLIVDKPSVGFGPTVAWVLNLNRIAIFFFGGIVSDKVDVHRGGCETREGAAFVVTLKRGCILHHDWRPTALKGVGLTRRHRSRELRCGILPCNEDESCMQEDHLLFAPLTVTIPCRHRRFKRLRRHREGDGVSKSMKWIGNK
jgi:hypothetical protein